ncbi:MAG TPA: DUF6600 domain-containing protein [Alphaproteobacteria bacterium]|nr:DUF6600 domain-containing protein [Alphaproteobacteria bacterium]
MIPIPTASRRRLRRGLLLASLAPAVLALVMSGGASAQDSPEDSGTPPALVGRIAGTHGQVSMHRADQQDWSQASTNEPISVGDAVYADVGGEARLEIGGARLVLKSDSELDIANLDQDSGRMRLDTGVLDIRVDALPTQDGLYILTPRGTVRLTRAGSYRIEAGTEDQPTRITSWDGAAEVGDSGAAVAVQPGQTLLIAGTPDAPQYSYDRNIGPTPEDVRPPPPRVMASIRSYVPPDMTGAEDLGEYGSWDEAPDYGAVWYPSDVPADWQPYHYGHWEFVPPWGWTWIDDEPWGFAPFHYGRWAFIGGRWGWCPGRYERHPVYAPALVAFIGGGALAASISVGFGGGEPVGWVPLAPGEVYRPWYHASNTYIQNINRTVIVNNTTINRTVIEQGPRPIADFANRRFATVVPAAAMASERPVAKAAIAVQPAALEHVQASPQVVAAIQHPQRPAGPSARPGPAFQQGTPTPAALAARPVLPPAGRQPGAPIPQRPVPAGIHPNLPPQAGAARPTPGPRAQPPAAGAPAAAPPRPGMPQGAALPQGFRGLPPAPPPPRPNAPAINQAGPPERQPGFRAQPPGAAPPPPRPSTMERQQIQHAPAPPPPQRTEAPQRPAFAPAPQHAAPPPMERPAPAMHAAPPPRPAPAPSLAAPRPAPPPQQAFRPPPQPRPAPAPAARPAPPPAARPAPAPAAHPAPPPANNQKKDEQH